VIAASARATTAGARNHKKSAPTASPAARASSTSRWPCVKVPATMRALISAGAEIAPMSVAQFGDFVRSEIRKNTDLLSEDFCSRVLYGGCEGFGTLQ